jgi:nicotinate-nucleotide--dimethylbenzimidazole phosphoribosyltransferase
VVAFGEMGIANTSAASLLLHKLADVPLDVATGRGTGVDEAGLQRKQAVLARAAARTGALRDQPLQALAEYGGFEIAMMAGAMLGAAEAGMLVLVDGFITSSAMLVASRLAPEVLLRRLRPPVGRARPPGHAAGHAGPAADDAGPAPGRGHRRGAGLRPGARGRGLPQRDGQLRVGRRLQQGLKPWASAAAR